MKNIYYKLMMHYIIFNKRQIKLKGLSRISSAESRATLDTQDKSKIKAKTKTKTKTKTKLKRKTKHEEKKINTTQYRKLKRLTRTPTMLLI